MMTDGQFFVAFILVAVVAITAAAFLMPDDWLPDVDDPGLNPDAVKPTNDERETVNP